MFLVDSFLSMFRAILLTSAKFPAAWPALARQSSSPKIYVQHPVQAVLGLPMSAYAGGGLIHISQAAQIQPQLRGFLLTHFPRAPGGHNGAKAPPVSRVEPRQFPGLNQPGLAQLRPAVAIVLCCTAGDLLPTAFAQARFGIQPHLLSKSPMVALERKAGTPTLIYSPGR